MKSFAIVAVVVLLALVRSIDACADVTVYQACIQQETTQLNTCGATDWVCRCPWERAILTCYNDCPDDANVQQQAIIQQGQVTTICTAANQTLAASSAAASSVKTSATSAPASSSVSNTLLTNIPSSTTAGPSATPSQKNAASANQVVSGVVVAGLAVVVALLAL